ncbi:conserved hypothetical protein [Luteimonas sp. 9C]|uniref:hypothetical protein n=1 Tax=Luteimonas sp. 9C TaxID=2653148 RepID=UPI0012F39C38|nr:hypothetical protein [Luteimonas sp. 9C]VXC14026.1 conserved hypothetical protein [Luteimonas sp. 9C]
MARPAQAHDFAITMRPRRTLHTVVAELKAHVRRQKALGARQLAWSVNVGGLSDETLDDALAAMARVDCVGTWEREYGFVAHFTLTW